MFLPFSVMKETSLLTKELVLKYWAFDGDDKPIKLNYILVYIFGRYMHFI